MENKGGKIAVVVIVVIILLIIILVIAKNLSTTSTTTVGPTTNTNQQGLGDIFGTILDWFKPKPKPVVCVDGCDQNKPGYDCNGFPDVNCNFG